MALRLESLETPGLDNQGLECSFCIRISCTSISVPAQSVGILSCIEIQCDGNSSTSASFASFRHTVSSHIITLSKNSLPFLDTGRTVDADLMLLLQVHRRPFPSHLNIQKHFIDLTSKSV
ncbi:hypothetical protein CDAR_427541 [Caerostris darwini]|uniref:Uncharacterized protein n=1 Tax=Caerostris darwini TaxID=1538125 RepID=A0AAV4WUV7_9ARAC|nr:hypothetical protein CDAR_427541 [Caerostris darwini]